MSGIEATEAVQGDVLSFHLHRLAAVFGDSDELHIDDKDVKFRRGLDAHFRDPKYIQVLQAIATLLTRKRQSTVALMLGFAQNETHLYYRQNGDGPDEDTRTQLNSIWKSLREVRQVLRLNPPTRTAEQKVNVPQDVWMPLFSVAYRYVANKALHRASKRAKSIDGLAIAIATVANPFEQSLVKMLRVVAISATAAAALRVEGICTPAVFESSSWEAFWMGTHLVHEYIEAAAPGAMERLQNEATALPDGRGFDLPKYLRKILKVEQAVMTLYRLAASANRGLILHNDLVILSAPPSPKLRVTLTFADFAAQLPTSSTESDSDTAAMRAAGVTSTTEDVTIISQVHSEVHLISWILDNFPPPEVTLAPYITCSKLHCFACFVWLEEFNTVGGDTRLPHLAFDGSYRGLQPGWLLPNLQSPKEESISTLMVTRMRNEFTYQRCIEQAPVSRPLSTPGFIFSSEFHDMMRRADSSYIPPP